MNRYQPFTVDKLAVRGPKVTFYLPDFSGGGAERVAINLAGELRRQGLDAGILVDRDEGPLRTALANGVPVKALGGGSVIAAFPKLVRHLKSDPPDVLISGLGHNSIAALWARRLTGAPTRVAIQQHGVLSEQAKLGGWRQAILPLLYRLFGRWADAVVSVSAGSADDMARAAGLPRATIRVIGNPIVDQSLFDKAAATVDHPFLVAGAPPVFLGVGRLAPLKDFATLLRAFAKVRASQACRLIVLGDGPERERLRALAVELGVAEDVSLAGFVANPFAFMRQSAALVVSSRYEGFGNVLVEAMAVGTPVISADCPFGPAEILEHGRWGRLVPVADPEALATAMREVMNQPPDPALGRRRAMDFSVEAIGGQFAALVEELLTAGSSPAESARPKSGGGLETLGDAAHVKS